MDNDCTFAWDQENFEITTKPHGHGDVHLYLNQSGLLKKFNDEGREYMFVFNDTNPLVFRMLPSVVGASVKHNLAMNSITIPRVPGEAIGAICKIENKALNKTITTNIEYNIMSNLAKSLEGGKEPTDAHGYSVFPGNSNAILFHIPSYNEVLKESNGNVPEFCNPKYANEEKTTFKTPTRIESLISELPRIMDENVHNVGFTQLDRIMCFTAAKNNLESGKQKFLDKMAPETAGTCEHDFYLHNRLLLEWAGVELEKSEEKYSFEGIDYEHLPKIMLMPSFSTTLAGLRDSFRGKNVVSSKST